jgi:hypothetical protein
MSVIGTIFTQNTFSKYLTKEIVLQLDPQDVKHLAMVNRFCNNLVSDEDVQIAMATKNLNSGRASTHTKLRWTKRYADTR